MNTERTQPPGFVELRNGRYRVSTRKKTTNLITNEIILAELQDLLAAHFGDDRQRALLDVGAGEAPYAPVYRPHFTSVVTTDVAHSPLDVSTVDVLAPAESLPFDDESFDCVLLTEVLEHTRDPRLAMQEISRVLRPGGFAFITTPFLIPLHMMPYDFYRYTPSALADLVEQAGLELVSITPKGEYTAVFLSMVHRPVGRALRVLSRKLRINLFHPWNPVVFGFVVLPQRLYLALWRRMRRRDGGRWRRTYDKLTYATLGYVTVVTKSPEMEPDRRNGA